MILKVANAMCTAQSKWHAYTLYQEERKESDERDAEMPRKKGEGTGVSGKEAEGKVIESEHEHDKEDKEIRRTRRVRRMRKKRRKRHS